MESLASIQYLLNHACWANSLMLQSFTTMERVPEEAEREMAHVIGAEEVWLSRIESRSSRMAVWPDLKARELKSLAGDIQEGYKELLDNLAGEDLAKPIVYTNSEGRSFTTRLADILMHVALHGQYHRGKINLLLSQAGKDPVPTDYIAFVRGVPAATSR